MRDAALAFLALLGASLVAVGFAGHVRRPRQAPERSAKRVLFPFVGRALSRPALDATLRLARAEAATLVPAFLVQVPMALPLVAPLPGQCEEALPLLEAIEQLAARARVPVDSRIERGRTHRHALRELLAHEPYDRLVVAASTSGTDGFAASDIAWLLEHAGGEILVLRPTHDRLLRGAAAPRSVSELSPDAGPPRRASRGRR